MAEEKKKECGEPCDVFSRIVGYFRPIKRWSDGKREEFKHRKTYKEDKAKKNKFKKQTVTKKEGLDAFIKK